MRDIKVLLIEKQGRQEVPVNMSLQELTKAGIKLSDENVKSITVVGEADEALAYLTDRMERFAEAGFVPGTLRRVESDITGNMRTFGVTLTKQSVLTVEEADALLEAAF